MTDTFVTTTAPTATGRSHSSAATLLSVGVLLGGFVIFAGNTDLKAGDNGGLGPAIFSAVLVLALAAVLWFVVLPRVKNVDRTVVVLAAVAVVSMVAFWLGITPLLAAAAAAVAGKRAESSKTALVGCALAVLAAAATVVVSVMQSRVF